MILDFGRKQALENIPVTDAPRERLNVAKKKEPGKAAEDLAGKKAPRQKAKKKEARGGTRDGAGRKAKWEPEEGQRFKLEEVMEEGLKARDKGDESDKAIKEAEEHDRRANIMIARLEPKELDFLVEAIVNAPWNGAASITKWDGFKLRKDQDEWLRMVWGPTIRFYIPYFLIRWGHLAIPILLTLPVLTHKIKGFSEHVSKTKRQRQASALDRERQGAGRQDDSGLEGI